MRLMEERREREQSEEIVSIHTYIYSILNAENERENGIGRVAAYKKKRSVKHSWLTRGVSVAKKHAFGLLLTVIIINTKQHYLFIFV